MIPKGERSIRNIPVPPNHRRPPVAAPPPEVEEDEQYEDILDEPVLPRKKIFRMKKNWFFWVALAVLVVCIIGGIALSVVFAGATVEVTPHSAVVAVPATMPAALNPQAGTLPYQVVSTSRTASTTVKATGSSQVSTTASGQITIYNNYSTAAQPLIAKTRFEAPNGNIYRIKNAITVPGAKAAADGSLTPGTVTATVYADAAGSTYNLGQAQLTIPGFKGDPRFTKFYAQTTGITGGFVGQQASISPADLTTAQTALKQGLQNALQNAAATQIPKEFLPIASTLAISYADIVQTPVDGGMVILSQTASATVDTVRATDLATAIAVQEVPGYKGEPVTFADTSAIIIAVAGGSDPSQPTIQLALSGSPKLVWQFDPATLTAALVGKKKGDFEQIVKSFAPAIQCDKDTPCTASIRPFWGSTFPSNPAKIKVVTQ